MTASRLDFRDRVIEADPGAQRSWGVRTLMLNVGRRCELSCAHCHHRCSPEATEVMSAEVLGAALELAVRVRTKIVDVTGGSPELWPLLPELVREAGEMGLQLRLRTNLMALSSGENAELARLLASHRVTVLASLPGTSEESVGALRGGGVFRSSLRALKLLAELGYGRANGPVVELAWNPREGLPRPESELHKELTAHLAPEGVHIARVRTIANVPLGNYGDLLRRADSFEPYLQSLAEAFDSAALVRLPCREGVEVGWDGRLFDCDFNLAAGMPLVDGPRTVEAAIEDPDSLTGRRIAFASHCFACTVGAGSG